jgi:hypothetical protein
MTLAEIAARRASLLPTLPRGFLEAAKQATANRSKVEMLIEDGDLRGVFLLGPTGQLEHVCGPLAEAPADVDWAAHAEVDATCFSS